MSGEPCFDIAHLAHVELLTDKPAESLDFFVNVYGLTESGREGDSVFLRAWDDYEFHTLKLTAAKTTGIGHVAYRATSAQALQRRVEAIEAMGCGIGWVDGDLGHACRPARQVVLDALHRDDGVAGRAHGAPGHGGAELLGVGRVVPERSDPGVRHGLQRGAGGRGRRGVSAHEWLPPCLATRSFIVWSW